MPPISLLELGRVREGSDRRTALDDARALACAAESWGYRRIWVAEHHNMPIVTTAAQARARASSRAVRRSEPSRTRPSSSREMGGMGISDEGCGNAGPAS